MHILTNFNSVLDREVFSLLLLHNWKNIQRSRLSRFAEILQIMKSGRSLSLRSAPIRWCSNWPMSAKQSQDWRQQEKSILHWGRQVCLCSVAYRWEHICHTGTWWYACPPPRSHWSTSGRLLLIYQLPGLSAYRVDGRAIPCSVNPLPELEPLSPNALLLRFPPNTFCTFPDTNGRPLTLSMTPVHWLDPAFNHINQSDNRHQPKSVKLKRTRRKGPQVQGKGAQAPCTAISMMGMDDITPGSQDCMFPVNMKWLSSTSCCVFGQTITA